VATECFFRPLKATLLVTTADISNEASELRKPPRVSLILVVFVGGMIALDVLGSRSASEQAKQSPGAERGDIFLEDSALPDEIGSWRKASPVSVVPPNELPDWQYWWTHSWQYQQSELRALVAMDQADWVYWHELTVCYESNGWTLNERQVMRGTEADGWPFVVANISNPDGRSAIIAFSMFTDTGEAGDPPDFFSADDHAAVNLTGRLQQRANHQRNSLPRRLLQCQIFVPYRGKRKDAIQAEATSLHLATRAQFRDHWCKNRANPILRNNQTPMSRQ